ncbi:MAG: NUDIX hydrolase [Lentimicrobium sp.]|nr:NUDIX hydrolase [Lentimicrobium sp.]
MDLPLIRIEVSGSKSIKEAVREFTNLSNPIQSIMLFNNSNAKKLLDEFISLFWYLEAAGGIVKNAEGKRLFIYRFGKWDLPKGKIEKGESHSEAAIREVMEETGVSGIELGCELPSTFHMYEHKGKRVLKRTYWFAMHCSTDGPLVPQQDEGITEVAWFETEQLGKILRSTYASLHDLLQSDIQLRG